MVDWQYNYLSSSINQHYWLQDNNKANINWLSSQKHYIALNYVQLCLHNSSSSYWNWPYIYFHGWPDIFSPVLLVLVLKCPFSTGKAELSLLTTCFSCQAHIEYNTMSESVWKVQTIHPLARKKVDSKWTYQFKLQPTNIQAKNATRGHFYYPLNKSSCSIYFAFVFSFSSFLSFSQTVRNVSHPANRLNT